MPNGSLERISGGSAVMAKILIKICFISLLVLAFPFIASSQEIYEYGRMWPVLEQPWYFFWPNGIALESSGNVYVAETWNCRIQKFTSSGQFVTRWGSEGSGDGQFNYPEGIAIDSSGNVYVADTNNHRIQKFTSNGQFITKWGSSGSGDGQFNYPEGIAIDSSGNVYVADTGNDRIQKFTSNGQFITKWGSSGSGDGQFSAPGGIALDSSGNVYVADTGNHRIQKFTSSGQFITKWGSSGGGEGQFNLPGGIALDSSGNVYVTDAGNNWIQKFTSSGQFVTWWGSGRGSGDGQFYEPGGIAVDSGGNVYVADTWNCRIQKFTSSGQFITKWGSSGSGDGQFNHPEGIAIDSSGNAYVADTDNDRIQKFTSSGQFITKWGSSGSGDGQFNGPGGIALDSSGNVYVADTWNYRIQKFTSSGQFVTTWGNTGEFNGPGGIAVDSSGNVYVADTWNYRIQKFTSSGQFITEWGTYVTGTIPYHMPAGIAVDSSGNVYVADENGCRVQKFTSSGQFVTTWGSYCSEDGFNSPWGLAVDSSDNVYVADMGNDRIQKFTSSGQFITKWGIAGSNAGEFSQPNGISISSDGKVYVADSGNHRIQVFSKVSEPFKNKAIVVAGSGPYEGNNLWDATEMNANYAYRVLTYQGYTNDTIYYLSSDRNLDLNGDGIPDVDGDATNSNLQNAITQWGNDAESLMVYLTGHGGDGTFRMSETEILNAEDLVSWLNELQQTIPGLVTLVYDACESGSFVSKLAPPSGKQRITITSTSPGESAYFLSQGALSFSYTFWSQIFGGAKIYDAYVMGKDVIGVAMGAGKSQNPEIDDNGNGIGNEKTDGDLASNTYIGKGFATAGDIPSISGISPDQVLNGQTSATITVEVVSTGKITRVWAIVHSPDFSNNPDNPITDLPSFDLIWNEQNQRYEGTYNGFTVMGTYTVTVYAMNENMIISLPKTTKIEQVLSNQYTLTVTISPSNSAGSVTKNPNKSTYGNGDTVTLTATPNTGYAFTNWTGDATGNTNPITLTMDGSKTVVANFTAGNVPDISVTPLSYDFGNVKVKKSKSALFKVQNNGKANLTIATLIVGPDASMFTLTSGGGNKTIKPGKFSTVKVTFKPTSTGSKQATLRITSNDPDTPTTDIPLSGTGQ